MTVAELYMSVAQLGFEDSLEYEDAFILAANRALLQVNALRPATRSYTLAHVPPENLIKGVGHAPFFKTNKELVFEATDAVAYYFEACGNGLIAIETKDESGEWRRIGDIPFSSTGMTAYRGFIKDGTELVPGTVRLRAEGQYAYTLQNVAMYGYVFSDDEADIRAFNSHTAYDISTLVPDFMSLATPPIRAEDGFVYLNQGYDVENGRILLLPREQQGIYKVVYNRRPRAIESDNYAATDETVIDLDEELCALLPMLIASYIWADDEPEKAQYYLSLYRERASEIVAAARNPAPVTIKSVNGW